MTRTPSDAARDGEPAPESAKQIVRHKAHLDLPGKWRSRQLRYGSYALEVELPCINGLSAWFSVAIFHGADEAERMMTDGARQEASEYAAKFLALSSRLETAREEWRPIETPQTFGGLTLDDIEALLPEIELEGVGYIEDCDHVAQDAIKSMIGFIRSLSVKAKP